MQRETSKLEATSYCKTSIHIARIKTPTSFNSQMSYHASCKLSELSAFIALRFNLHDNCFDEADISKLLSLSKDFKVQNKFNQTLTKLFDRMTSSYRFTFAASIAEDKALSISAIPRMLLASCDDEVRLSTLPRTLSSTLISVDSTNSYIVMIWCLITLDLSDNEKQRKSIKTTFSEG